MMKRLRTVVANLPFLTISVAEMSLTCFLNGNHVGCMFDAWTILVDGEVAAELYAWRNN